MSTKNGWKVLMGGENTTIDAFAFRMNDDRSGVYSEDAPPTDLADRFNASFPNNMSIGLAQRQVEIIAEMDK